MKQRSRQQQEGRSDGRPWAWPLLAFLWATVHEAVGTDQQPEGLIESENYAHQVRAAAKVHETRRQRDSNSHSPVPIRHEVDRQVDQRL